VQTVLTTRRLVVRSWRDDDVEPLATMGRDPEFVRYLQGRLWTRADAEDMIDRCRTTEASIGVTMWALEDLRNGELVGYCGFAPTNATCLRPEVLEIGWAIDRQRWGHGLATEAADALLRLAASRFAHTRVVAKCHIDNVGSERVMQRIGLRRLGVVRYLATAGTTLYGRAPA